MACINNQTRQREYDTMKTDEELASELAILYFDGSRQGEIGKKATDLIGPLHPDKEGESFAMMVAMGFFTFSAPRYQMTIPSHLTEMQVKQAILNFSQTEDAEFMLHPEHLVTAISLAEARAWQDRMRAIDGFHDNLCACAGTLN
jgi:hypothetical protein